MRAAADLPAMQLEPMFCFETAIKAFYWSSLIYLYSDAHDPEVPLASDLRTDRRTDQTISKINGGADQETG